MCSKWTRVSLPRRAPCPTSMFQHHPSVCPSALSHGWAGAHTFMKHLACISSLISPSEAVSVVAPIIHMGKLRLRAFTWCPGVAGPDSGCRIQFPVDARRSLVFWAGDAPRGERQSCSLSHAGGPGCLWLPTSSGHTPGRTPCMDPRVPQGGKVSG